MRTLSYNTAFKISLACLIGIFFLWLALRNISFQEFITACKQLQITWLLIALLSYCIALALRATRWQLLLNNHTTLPYKSVLNALLIGYAMNNVLPARIGELFRANFCKTQYGLSMSYVLGSIVIERLADGLIVSCALALGMLLLHFYTENHHALVSVATVASLLFSGVACFVVILSCRNELPTWLTRSPKLAAKINNFHHSIKTIRSRAIFPVIISSLIIWGFELATLWALLHATHIALNIIPMLVTIGVVSLSTLLPSPPGYLGTLQFAYVIVAKTFGFPVTLGIVAATAHQLFLFLPLCLVGFMLYAASSLKKSFKMEQMNASQN